MKGRHGNSGALWWLDLTVGPVVRGSHSRPHGEGNLTVGPVVEGSHSRSCGVGICLLTAQ